MMAMMLLIVFVMRVRVIGGRYFGIFKLRTIEIDIIFFQ